MGVYKDKKTKTWYVSKRYTDWTGRQKRLFKRGFKSKKQAVEYEQSFLTKNDGALTMLFDDFIDIYYEDIKDRIKLNTFITKQVTIEKLIRPYFKDIKMNEITTATVMKWQNELLKKKNSKGKRYAGETLRTIHAQLSAIFNHAIRFYGLTMNPAKMVGAIRTDDVKEQKIWTYEQYSQFSNTIADKTLSYISFEILFWCGLRLGELLALTSEDVDFENNKIHVYKSLQRIKGEIVITTPKTKRSNRYVDMPSFLADELKNYIEHLYKPNENDLLLPVTKSYLHHEMERGCKEIGLEPIRIHDLRHSHVSLLIENGYSAVDVANRVGHESERITYIYAHAYAKRGKEMATTLENIEGGSNNNE